MRNYTRLFKFDGNVERTCSICLCEYENGDELRKLNCAHVFHAECISMHLQKTSGNCPICRQGIREAEDLHKTESTCEK